MSNLKTLSAEEQTTAPTNEQIVDAIANVNPDVVLRNLAFWLDVAIARGRWYDSVNTTSNVVPTPEGDPKPEV